MEQSNFQNIRTSLHVCVGVSENVFPSPPKTLSSTLLCLRKKTFHLGPCVEALKGSLLNFMWEEKCSLKKSNIAYLALFSYHRLKLQLSPSNVCEMQQPPEACVALKRTFLSTCAWSRFGSSKLVYIAHLTLFSSIINQKPKVHPFPCHVH